MSRIIHHVRHFVESSSPLRNEIGIEVLVINYCFSRPELQN